MKLMKCCVIATLTAMPLTSKAAKPINLSHATSSQIQALISQSSVEFREVWRGSDHNNTVHKRVKQYYLGYPVWGADGVLHGDGGMNGLLYQDLSQDLPPLDNVDKAKQLIVYVDQARKAHWAYYQRNETSVHIFVMIVDAISHKVYEKWDDMQTLKQVPGGGIGGNVKQGKLIFDGYDGHLAGLTFMRDDSMQTCYLKNPGFEIQNYAMNHEIMHFKCSALSKAHNNVYWFNEDDAVNGAYSPAIDALYGAKVVKNMYRDWYNLPPLTKDGKPMKLVIEVHHPKANASWSNNRVILGDSVGSDKYYPFTPLDVVGHEIGHGVTRQHANLVYDKQSGGLNEAFSDMSAQATEYYEYGHNSWLIGYKFMRDEGKSLRYMDQPSRDCYGKQPGDNCSIDHISQYHDGLNVHKSSGLFNRVFYLIGSTDGWNAHRAFDIMLQANRYYWTPTTTFADAACGVLSAARDYHYNTSAVYHAFDVVGINLSEC